MQRRLVAIVAIAGCLLLTGCEEVDLYSNLTEREANEMVAVITEAGMDASKVSKDGKVWTLATPKREFPQVVALLDARGYPKDRYETLGEIFKKEGFISSPVEEHARLVYGLSQELSNTISAMNGVVFARVHVSLPEQDPLSDTRKVSSAAVFIRYDPQVDLSSQVGSIKSLVVNSIEGLPYDRVSVVLSPAHSFYPPTPRPAWPAAMAAKSVLGLGALASALAMAFWLWNAAKKKRGAG